MGSLDATQGARLLNTAFGVSTPILFTGPPSLRLVSTPPTPTAGGTELPNGGGYVTGGISLAANLFMPTSGLLITGPTSDITLTNSSGNDWTVAGWELWDADPLRWALDTWDTDDGQPLTVPDGGVLTIPAGGIQFDLVPG